MHRNDLLINKKKNSVKKKSVQEYEWDSDIRRSVEPARFFPNLPDSSRTRPNTKYPHTREIFQFSTKNVYKTNSGYIRINIFKLTTTSKFILYRFKCSRIYLFLSIERVNFSREREGFSFRRRIYGSKWYWEEWRVKFWTLDVHTYAHGPLLIPAHWSHSLEAYSRS